MSTQEVLLAEALTQVLIRHGTRRIFGIPGGYLNHLLSAFSRSGLPGVEARHEGALACMAAGYAQASGEIGVLYAQSGPGVTNTLTGMTAAYMDSVPLLLLAGQCPQNDYGRDSHQEATGATRGIDQLSVFRELLGSVYRPPTPESAVRMLRVALTHAKSRREPAVVELAANMMPAKIQFEDRPAPPIHDVAVDVRGVEELARMIHAAKSPVLVIGNRATHCGAAGDLLALVEAQEMACTCVDYAKGVIAEDHPLFLGVLGAAGHRAVADYLRNADLVIGIGVRLNVQSTYRFDMSLFPRFAQVEADASEIGRSVPVELGVVGDIPATIRALRTALGTASAATKAARSETRARVAELRAAHHVYMEKPGSDDKFTTANAMRVLRRHLPRETRVVGDVGLTAQLLKKNFPVYAPDGFFSLYAYGAMGSGLPISLGVQLAQPEWPIVSVIGDGGFLLHAGELSVAAQHDLPVITVVINNGGYKQVRDRLTHWFDLNYGCDIKNPNYAKLAEAFDCEGYTATNQAELSAAMEKVVHRRRPSVVECRVDGDNLVDILPPEMLRNAKGVGGFADEPPRGWPFPRP
jgi:acetolactate synthase-1/2/3 large subunit